jgi:hypothetical protein
MHQPGRNSFRLERNVQKSDFEGGRGKFVLWLIEGSSLAHSIENLLESLKIHQPGRNSFRLRRYRKRNNLEGVGAIFNLATFSIYL